MTHTYEVIIRLMFEALSPHAKQVNSFQNPMFSPCLPQLILAHLSSKALADYFLSSKVAKHACYIYKLINTRCALCYYIGELIKLRQGKCYIYIYIYLLA